MFSRILRSSVNLIPWGLRDKIKRVPVLAAFQRWVVRRFLHDQTFVHVINAGPANGLAYPVTLPRDKSIWTGTYEAHFASALAASVRPGDVCFDIGGYRGFMGGVCARAGAGLVVVFEPFPANCDQIRRMASLNPSPPIRLQPIAVGDRDGEVEFKVMAEESMGKLNDSPFQKEAVPTVTMRVPIRRLDSLIEEGLVPPPKVIKLDVEGAELLALKGATQSLRRFRPCLLIEAHSTILAQDCTALLESLNYRITNLSAPEERKSLDETQISHLKAQPLEIC